jgi:hypothetical protein
MIAQINIFKKVKCDVSKGILTYEGNSCVIEHVKECANYSRTELIVYVLASPPILLVGIMTVIDILKSYKQNEEFIQRTNGLIAEGVFWVGLIILISYIWKSRKDYTKAFKINDDFKIFIEKGDNPLIENYLTDKAENKNEFMWP